MAAIVAVSLGAEVPAIVGDTVLVGAAVAVALGSINVVIKKGLLDLVCYL